jgi:acetylornithine/succinyldiaminopimelate/putrescine aminotransferase
MAEMALAQMADEVVGIIVEPIQGAGGQRVADPRFFRGLSELCEKYDVYLAFDEVQTEPRRDRKAVRDRQLRSALSPDGGCGR